MRCISIVSGYHAIVRSSSTPSHTRFNKFSRRSSTINARTVCTARLECEPSSHAMRHRPLSVWDDTMVPKNNGSALPYPRKRLHTRTFRPTTDGVIAVLEVWGGGASSCIVVCLRDAGEMRNEK